MWFARLELGRGVLETLFQECDVRPTLVSRACMACNWQEDVTGVSVGPSRVKGVCVFCVVAFSVRCG